MSAAFGRLVIFTGRVLGRLLARLACRLAEGIATKLKAEDLLNLSDLFLHFAAHLLVLTLGFQIRVIDGTPKTDPDT